MTQIKSRQIYDYLQNCVHHVNEDVSPSLFPTQDNNNNSEYWLFSDLYNLFGAPYVGIHNNIDNTVQIAIKNACSKNKTAHNKINFYNLYNAHAVSTRNDYQINTPMGIISKHAGLDARLSRYACWAIIRQWPNMIFSQLYFMTPNAMFNALNTDAKHFIRIPLRAQVAGNERIISAIAYRNNADMRWFAYYMHRAFFYGRNPDDIKSAYQIPLRRNDPISNYMGAASLAARRDGMNRAIKQLDENPNMRFEQFSKILYDELTTARVDVIKRTNRCPEQDICKQM